MALLESRGSGGGGVRGGADRREARSRGAPGEDPAGAPPRPGEARFLRPASPGAARLSTGTRLFQS